MIPIIKTLVLPRLRMEVINIQVSIYLNEQLAQLSAEDLKSLDMPSKFELQSDIARLRIQESQISASIKLLEENHK